MIRKRIGAFMMFALCLGGIFMSSVALSEDKAESAELRRPISTKKPLFTFACEYDIEPKTSVLGVWNAIPDDIKPFSAIEIRCNPSASGPGLNEQQEYERLDGWLKICQENGIKAIYQGCWGPWNVVSKDHIGELYKKYPCFIGWAATEVTWGDNWSELIAQHIDLAAQYGAYCFFGNSSAYSPGDERGLLAMLRKNQHLWKSSRMNKKYFIVTFKQTGDGRYIETEATSAGVWLAGHAGHWGAHTDTFCWQASGRGPVFGKKMEHRHYDNFKATINAPEALVGSQLLNHIYEGSTVYTTFEFPPYTVQLDGVRTPLFNNVIYPILKKIANGTFRIPSKKEVAARCKIAFIPDDTVDPRADLYECLYQMDGNQYNNDNWLKSTGRYYFIPVLPCDSSTYEKSLFLDVVTNSGFAKRFPSPADKVGFFNSIHPREYTGDTFVQRIDDTWYTYNPILDSDTNTTATIPLLINSCSELSLNYAPFTYGVVKELESRIDIHLNNYYTDKEDIWAIPPTDPKGIYIAPTSWWFNDVLDYLGKVYIPNPKQDAKRDTVYTIKGCDDKPKAKVSGNNGFSYTEDWNAGESTYTLTITHNGPVDIKINCSGSE